jgi:hypothetical protein
MSQPKLPRNGANSCAFLLPLVTNYQDFMDFVENPNIRYDIPPVSNPLFFSIIYKIIYKSRDISRGFTYFMFHIDIINANLHSRSNFIHVSLPYNS